VVMSTVRGKENVIVSKSYAFALEIVKLYKHITVEKKEYVLSKQIVRAGTAIGANINEAVAAQSKKDFVHKLGIASKEARETLYWLRLLKDSDYISNSYFEKLASDCNEIIKILDSIILTTKEKYLKL
jgi:four helix bundle protein